MSHYFSYRLKTVISDERAELVADPGDMSPSDEPQGVWMKYDILAHINQHQVIEGIGLLAFIKIS